MKSLVADRYPEPSKLKLSDFVAASLETVRLARSPEPEPGHGEHAAEVWEAHAIVAQWEKPTAADGVVSAAPKLRPLTVVKCPEDVTEFASTSALTAGASQRHASFADNTKQTARTWN